VFNLGGTEEISIGDLAERVIELVGSDSEVEYIPYDAAYEEGFEDMARRVPNTDRARRLVGFEPSVGLDDIILSVIADQQA
jgi:UDP-glucose 4-epimerase